MQQVKVLKDIDYSPSATDSRRCWGQIRLRTSSIPRPVNVEVYDGETFLRTVETVQHMPGPMVKYFPKGSTPELSDEIAQQFIADGVAEPFDLEVVTVDAAEMMTWTQPEAKAE